MSQFTLIFKTSNPDLEPKINSIAMEKKILVNLS
jgi:hypothetical protein